MLATNFEVHFNSSRTGVRLIGPTPKWARKDGGEAGLHPSNIHDNAYAVGTLDLTGDMPILLGPDGPSLGGFVCPVTTASAEFWKIGQLHAGDTVRFKLLSLEEANALRKNQERFLDELTVVSFEEMNDVTYMDQADPATAILFKSEKGRFPMGLIRAGIGAAKGVLEDQWRDYFYCESLPSTILVKKGEKKNQKRSLFKHKVESNVISNGSIIAINDGQAMAIVDQGKIIEFCAEPGEFLFDTSSEASIFYGDLSENIKESFKNFGKRFTFGGEAPKDTRIYFFNTKEIPGNKYGTPSPVPFRVVDQNIGLDIDISIRTNGEYSYKIVDPILFYTNVTGNVAESYERSQIEDQLRTELLTALQPAYAKISAMGIRYSALPGHTLELAEALNEVLSVKWTQLRGIKIVSFGINTVNASEEDEKMIKQLQRNATLRNPNMAAAHLTGAQADAMIAAANNDGGALTGFAGMNMANGTGGMNASQLFEMGAKQQAQAEAVKPAQGASWKCSCGTQNTGKFCSNCGKPEPVNTHWTCSCGAQNTGKFCSNCGKTKPVVAHVHCDKCGWQSTEGTAPKFCPECGDPITDADLKAY